MTDRKKKWTGVWTIEREVVKQGTGEFRKEFGYRVTWYHARNVLEQELKGSETKENVKKQIFEIGNKRVM